MVANVTAYSDETLKRDWAAVPADYVDRLAKLLAGTYTRTDTGERQAGVGAQSLLPLLPETVLRDENGVLSVAYGNAAMVSCVALAQRLIAIEERLEGGE